MIRYLALYNAMYSATLTALKSRVLQVESLPTGTTVQRIVEKGHLYTTWQGARKIPPKSASNSEVRFSGARPFGKASPRDGALYVSAGYAPNLAEALYYNLLGPSGAISQTPSEAVDLRVAFDMGMVSPKLAMVKHVQFIYRTTSILSVLTLKTIARTLSSDRTLSKELNKNDYSNLESAILAEDYSAARAIGAATVDCGQMIDGIYAPTARRIPPIEGMNLVLFGREGQELTFLNPVALRVFYLAAG